MKVPFSSLLEEKKPFLGTFVQSGAPEFLEASAYAGFRYAAVDLEHTYYGVERTAEMIRAGEAADLCMLARVPCLDATWIKKSLDFGASGIIVPNVDTAEQARQAVDSNRDAIKSDTKTLINALDRFRRVTWHLGDELDDSRMDQTIDRLGDSFGKMVDALGGMGAGVEELQDATVELYDLMDDLEKAHDREKQQKLV